MEKAKQYFCAKPNGKLHYPHTILTGFGFLASSIAWAIYDPYITKILNHLLNNSATITSWSAKLNAAFPALAEFAAATARMLQPRRRHNACPAVHRYHHDV